MAELLTPEEIKTEGRIKKALEALRVAIEEGVSRSKPSLEAQLKSEVCPECRGAKVALMPFQVSIHGNYMHCHTCQGTGKQSQTRKQSGRSR